MSFNLVGSLSAILTAAALVSAAAAADDKAAGDQVDLFQAIDDGQIEARLILKDAKKGNLLIKNNGKQPLQIRMPEGFAGKPVLAQLGGIAGPGLGGLAGGQGGLNQGVGGVMPGGVGGGLFNVPPEQLKKVPVAVVCLEHGKRDPNPRVKYAIIPMEQYTDDSRVHEMLRLFNSGKLSQRAVQVAAWHLASGMSFQELAAKTLDYANGTKKPYFSRAELEAGYQIASTATQRAKEKQQTQQSVSSSDR
ncbi:MAG: hypothetical protein MI757_16145 [Pirellulales bacterium]|nr:hypothetical protein [Pirellulales bacterium]